MNSYLIPLTRDDLDLIRVALNDRSARLYDEERADRTSKACDELVDRLDGIRHRADHTTHPVRGSEPRHEVVETGWGF